MKFVFPAARREMRPQFLLFFSVIVSFQKGAEIYGVAHIFIFFAGGTIFQRPNSRAVSALESFVSRGGKSGKSLKRGCETPSSSAPCSSDLPPYAGSGRGHIRTHIPAKTLKNIPTTLSTPFLHRNGLMFLNKILYQSRPPEYLESLLLTLRCFCLQSFKVITLL